MPSQFLFSDQFNDPFIVLRPVRECAVAAYLDCTLVSDFIGRIPGAIVHMIQRTIAEETVKFLCSLMARIILAISVLKIPV